jgi:hypothetical protein
MTEIVKPTLDRGPLRVMPEERKPIVKEHESIADPETGMDNAEIFRKLRMLEAIASVLPPELRARAGGVIQVAGLKTAKAGTEEIERRLAILSPLVEEYLHKENAAALERLIEKANYRCPSEVRGDYQAGRIGLDEAVGILRKRFYMT